MENITYIFPGLPATFDIQHPIKTEPVSTVEKLSMEYENISIAFVYSVSDCCKTVVFRPEFVRGRTEMEPKFWAERIFIRKWFRI